MIFTRFVSPIFFMLLGLVFFIGSLNIPKAKLGDPYGPLYFPTIISAFLIIMSIIYFISEFRKEYKQNKDLQLILAKRTPFLIISTIILAILYTFAFEVVGFLVSTILFLVALLFIINGRKKWIINIVVALVFSFSAWYVFSQLLKVSLP